VQTLRLAHIDVAAANQNGDDARAAWDRSIDEDQIGTLSDLQTAGKIAHIGLSNVSLDEVLEAESIAPIATVQNRYNLTDRESERVLNFCSDAGLGFIPWSPMAAGGFRKAHPVLADLAQQWGATPSQVVLAWLLRRSPVMLPIPGTSSVAHLEENMGAASIHLTDGQFDALTRRI